MGMAKMGHTSGSKLRRVDRICPVCQTQMRIFLAVINNKRPKPAYYCEKCEVFYSKKQAQSFTRVDVLAQ